MAKCNTCALQFKDACPHQFGGVTECDRYVEKNFNPQPPRRGGRSVADPGEYKHDRRPPVPPPERANKPKAPAAPPKKSRKQSSPVTAKPVKPADRIRKGQRLFYRNKFTGIIETGTVREKRKDGFIFMFQQRSVFLSYSALGTRLFFSHEGARKHYLMSKAQKR